MKARGDSAVAERRGEALAPQQPAAPDGLVSAAEAEGLSPNQLSFLERKRRAAAGMGPILPERSTCKACSGLGEQRRGGLGAGLTLRLGGGRPESCAVLRAGPRVAGAAYMARAPVAERRSNGWR